MRLTLLINYWRAKDVGENFTHILPQEGAFLRRLDEVQAEERKEEGVEEEGGDGELFLAPPRVVDPGRVQVPRDILEYLEPFQAQTLAPDLMALVSASQTQGETQTQTQTQEGGGGRTPVALLSFPQNSSHSAYCRSLIEEQQMALGRFTMFSRDEATGEARVPQLGTLQSQQQWREGWPHLPEDHEQDVWDMFALLGD
jgi:hypothetical protein